MAIFLVNKVVFFVVSIRVIPLFMKLRCSLDISLLMCNHFSNTSRHSGATSLHSIRCSGLWISSNPHGKFPWIMTWEPMQCLYALLFVSTCRTLIQISFRIPFLIFKFLPPILIKPSNFISSQLNPPTIKLFQLIPFV